MPIGISRLGQMGLGKESAWGVPPTNITAGLAILSEDFSPDVKIEPLAEIYGSMETRKVGRGIEIWNGKIEFPCEIGGQGVGGVGEFLSSIFGKDTISGSADPYTHTIEVLNQTDIPSYTLWFDRNIGTYVQIEGFRPKTLTITIDRGASTIPVSVEGIARKESSSTAKTLVYSTEQLLSPANVGVTVDGTSASGWEKLTLEFSRDLEAISGLTGDDYISFLPSKEFGGKITASGVYGSPKLDDTIRSAYRTRTSLNIVISIVQSAKRSIIFTFPNVVLDSFSGPKMSGTDIIRANFTGIILKPTAGSNKVEIKNSRSTAY